MMDKLCILWFVSSCFVTFMLQFSLHNIYFFPLTNNCFWYIDPYFVAVRTGTIKKSAALFLLRCFSQNIFRFLKKSEKFFKNRIDKALKDRYTDSNKTVFFKDKECKI